MSVKVPQLVVRCIECGKLLLEDPTLLNTKTNVILLCFECYVYAKKHRGFKK